MADGIETRAYVAQPQHTDAAPGLILFQEAFGVNHPIRSVADRLAAAGYVVVAPELFHRTAEASLEIGYDNFAAAVPPYGALTPESLTQAAQAAYDWLPSQANVQPAKIGAIGFCLGGQVAFVANATVPLSAAVS